MIVGMGTDIIDKARIERALTHHRHNFVKKLLSATELAIYQGKKQPVDYLAKRWAAKEALGKALGTGIRQPVLLPNISVLNDDLGKPYFQLSPALADFVAHQQIDKLHLSISDEKTLAIAWVICEHLD